MKKNTNKDQNSPDLFGDVKKIFVRREDAQKANSAKLKLVAPTRNEHTGFNGYCRPYGIIRINKNTILVSHEALS